MDEKTEVLIRELSEKLGTTSEHLWSVLVAQAPIFSVSMIIVIVLAISVGLVLVSIGTKGFKKTDQYDDARVGYGIVITAGAVCLALSFFAIMIEADRIVAGLFNPEYLAWLEVSKLLGK